MIKQGAVGIFADKDLRTALKNIKCPLHHCLKPGLEPQEAFMLEPNPLAKGWNNSFCKEMGLKNWKYKRDMFGNKVPNFRNHFQPEISALYAKERIYSTGHPVCVKCRRCLQ